MQEGQQFNQERISEIQELKERLAKLETNLQKEKPVQPEEKERIIKQEIKSYIQETQLAPDFVSPPAKRDEAKEIKKFEPDQQVGALLNLVFEKGLKEAVQVAANLENPAILDELHDALVDHYYQTLVERGMIKP